MKGFGRPRKKPEITLSQLKERLDFDARTGLLIWKKDGKGGRGIRRGMPAGSVDPNGYRYIRIEGTDYLAQRLAWFYHYGTWPQGIIRFNDGDRKNCAIDNLRDAAVALAPNTEHDWRTKEGRSAQRKEYYRQNRERGRDWQLRESFGISLDRYNEMLTAQKELCAICGKPETIRRNGKVRWLAVDHCHSNGKVRGLLCGSCNPMIGYADDNIAILERAIAYLKQHGT